LESITSYLEFLKEGQQEKINKILKGLSL